MATKVQATQLTKEQIQALDTQGYVILPNVIPQKRLPELLEIFERQAAKKRQGGTRHADFFDEEAIASLRFHPLVMAAAHHVLGDDVIAEIAHGRDPQPGFGLQGLHADAPPRVGPYLIMTTIWMLDDFTKDNRPTRLVPGTHLLPGPVPKITAGPESHHPKETFAIGPAGSVLVFNGHTWHSGSRNNSKTTRRALQAVYHRPEFWYSTGMMRD